MATLSDQDRQALIALLNSDCVDWMEHNFYVPDPRDPITGEQFPPGPIRLTDIQKRIIRAAVTRVNGVFPYTTILFSAVKKSGKTRIAAGVAAWYADTQGMYNEVYCLANDGKQSSDRILSAIKQGVKLNPNLGWHITKTLIELPSGAFIEAVPCDPSGQAGANPGLTVWSEMWGFRHEHKERLWSEMTVPPTRWGQAFRWVESYAGYTDESNVLQALYELGTKHSAQHPAFPDLPVYVNTPARMLCYWDEQPRMPWQTPEYYAEEAATLSPDEFRRIHQNQWISSTEKAIQIEWWDACEDIEVDGVPLPPLDSRTPVVCGMDASVSHDCCAAAIISRHPQRRNDTAVRACGVWVPPVGGKIDLDRTMGDWLTLMKSRYNIVEVAYDEFQLALFAKQYREKLSLRFRQFSQMADRAVADKTLYQMILQKRIVHDGNRTLREHVDNAAAEHRGEKLRFVKPDRAQTKDGLTMRPIDGLIATSMANSECLRLLLG